MKKIKTLFVQKKREYDSESKSLINTFKDFLGITNIVDVQVLNKYLIKDVDELTFEKSLTSIFSEPMVDEYHLEKIPNLNKFKSFCVEFLPGQFDQRAESAKQCLLLINHNLNPSVKSAKVYLIEGKISDQELEKIKNFIINPTDSHEIDIFSTDFPTFNENNEKIEILNNFIKLTKQQLADLQHTLSLAMSMEDLLMIQDYFKKEKRNPTITEIKVIDTYWSDHCRHTTFETNITNIKFEKSSYDTLFKQTYDSYLKSREYVYGKNTNRKICLMDLATIAMKQLKKQGKLKSLDQSDEINACSININVKTKNGSEKYLLMFKNETHNHPTEIEPFGGASTCLGGSIRDPLSGRTYVYQAMRVSGSGDPTLNLSQKLQGKLPQRIITTNAANGYSSYGNQIGLTTGQVDEIYHPGYVAKRLETGAVIAAAPKSNVVRKKPKNGDVVILLGGKTGKDGIGGATGSSKKHQKTSIIDSGAEVQKGNPVEERKIQRLFKNPNASKLIIKCNDFGAGGVSVAIGELCDGLEIDLNKITKKYAGLNGTELAISESQERMAVVVHKKDASKFIKFAENENLEATIVANVTNTNRLRMKWKDQYIVDLSRDFLNTNGFTQTNAVLVDKPKEFIKSNVSDIKNEWIKMLTDLNVCSKLGLIQKFDSTIGANTVLMPLGGLKQITPAEGMAAKIPTFGKFTNTCSLMTYGFNPFIGEISPFHMGYYSVIESITKIVAMGGNYKNIFLSFQEYFRKLNTDPKRWGLPFAALLGAYKAQIDFNLAAIGGKDSMSGTYENLDVPSTLISFAVCVDDAKNIISPEFKKVDSSIIYLFSKKNKDETIDAKSLINNFELVNKLIQDKKIISAYSLKQKGVAEGISKMCLGNWIGAEINNIDENELFNCNYGSLILEIPSEFDAKKLLNKFNYKIIGKTKEKSEIIFKNFSISLQQVYDLYIKKLADIFPYLSNNKITKNLNIKSYKSIKHPTYSKVIKKPLVVIPVFPGTNCEFDSENAFIKAGAIVKQILIQNLNTKLLLSSINKLANAINKANIIFLPGGFSCGDEPDGSAKFIVNVFKNEKIKKATMNLIARKGLIIGICNGFQALIKLGLVPYGKIIEMNEGMPTLTFNEINHHMSTLIRTKVVSNKSPWFACLNPGDIRTNAVSHGEGKFVASDSLIKELINNGQIATQYVDSNNNPTMEMPFNPNGSVYAIEAITNLDGRILGKMGHSERIGENLYKNVPGEFDQKIFESGVKYFSRGK